MFLWKVIQANGAAAAAIQPQICIISQKSQIHDYIHLKDGYFKI